MHPRTPIPTSLLRLGASQSGVISRAQALEHGVGRHTIARLLRDGQWYPISDGIYSPSLSPEWTALAWTGVLLAGGHGVIGGEAAMHLHGVGDPPPTITVWCERHRLRDRDPWRLRQGARAARGSPPRVSIEEATLEVCATSSIDGVVSTLSAAVTSHRTTVDRLRLRAMALPNLRHRSHILDVLLDVSGGVESPLEHRYLRDVEQAHELPVGLRQVSVSKGTRSDISYVKHFVLVELDGRRGHHDGTFRDAARDNRHTVAGFVTLRFGWTDVALHPCAVAAQVATVLTSRGWCADTRRCRRCPSPNQQP